MNRAWEFPVALLAIAFVAAPAAAQVKIGFVNTERIFRDAAPAVRAQKKLEKEFEKRDQDLQRMAKQLQAMRETLDKNGMTMAESERVKKEREFAELNRDFQRKQREVREDLNQRRNEELAAVLEKTNKVIRQIAEAEKYDIIFQDAVYASPRIDVTEKVIKALAEPPAK
ncbi:MAG: OmpH family outer membrane protein [Rhodocyclaceae bacterium]